MFLASFVIAQLWVEACLFGTLLLLIDNHRPPRILIPNNEETELEGQRRWTLRWWKTAIHGSSVHNLTGGIADGFRDDCPSKAKQRPIDFSK